MAAGGSGNILPDDLLSGGSLWLIRSVLLSIPVVGSHAVQLLFGSEFAGESVVTAMYWTHTLVIPAVIALLLAAREWLVRRHGHWRFTASVPGRRAARPPDGGRDDQGAHPARGGRPDRTDLAVRSREPRPGLGGVGARLVHGVSRRRPAAHARLGAHVRGYTLSLAVLVPALVVPGVFFTVLAGYPIAERTIVQRPARRDALDRPKSKSRMAKDETGRATLDRPREAPVKTGIAAAGVTFYGLLWAAVANDQFAHQFHLGVEAVTGFFRFAVVIGPLIAFWVSHRICQALQDQDRHTVEHGPETGVIVQTARGGFEEREVGLDTKALT